MAKKRSPAPIIAIIAVICACAVAGILFLPGLLDGGEGIGDVIEIAGSEYKWRILDKKDDKALLITENIVDMRAYNELTTEQIALNEKGYNLENPDYSGTTWAECSLRKWLNEDFFNTLPDAMQSKISETDVVNNGNPAYDTSGGKNTMDKVFCLSEDEVYQYFSDDEDRISKFYPSDDQIKDIAERLANNPLYNTSEDYSIVEKAEATINGHFYEIGNNWDWWLRPHGHLFSYAMTVDDNGFVNSTIGSLVFNDGVGVRPALWLNL
jgi:hypothetical protein